jgi:large subunit ribosomal protein L30
MAKIKITQIKSSIDRPLRQKSTLLSLGLRKMHQSVVREANEQTLGMVAKVSHLTKVEEA